MALNGSELITAPWATMLSPFTNLLGNGFYLIPITFIALALYVKTRDVMASSVWILACGILLTSGSIFTGYFEMSIIYIIVAAAGITGIAANIMFMRR